MIDGQLVLIILALLEKIIVMKICSHEISAAEIIGIGPLMTNYFHTTRDNLYNRKQHYFFVHTKHQSIKIESDAVETQNCPTEYLAKTRKHLKDFLKDYDNAKASILTIIN